MGLAVPITYSPQNGLILLLMAFLTSPMGLPLAATGCWVRYRMVFQKNTLNMDGSYTYDSFMKILPEL